MSTKRRQDDKYNVWIYMKETAPMIGTAKSYYNFFRKRCIPFVWVRRAAGTKGPREKKAFLLVAVEDLVRRLQSGEITTG